MVEMCGRRTRWRTYIPELQVSSTLRLSIQASIFHLFQLLIDGDRLQFFEVHNATELGDHQFLAIVFEFHDALICHASTFHKLHVLPPSVAIRQQHMTRRPLLFSFFCTDFHQNKRRQKTSSYSGQNLAFLPFRLKAEV